MSKNKGYSEREVDITDEIPTFLIVCEGERTEPNYFRAFRVPTRPRVVDIDVRGLGYNTDTLVEETIRIKNEGDYDQVWAVFDRDSFPAQNFNRAIQLAKNNNIQVAYSNEAFELWYVLHYEYLDERITRKDYCKKLTKLMNRKYEKKDPDIYQLLKSKQATAIKNAKTLLTKYDPKDGKHADKKPSTTVHLLVQELNRFARG